MSDIVGEIKDLVSDISQKITKLGQKSDTIDNRESFSRDNSMKKTSTLKTAEVEDLEVEATEKKPSDDAIAEEEVEEILPSPEGEAEAEPEAEEDTSIGLEPDDTGDEEGIEGEEGDLDDQILDALSTVLMQNPDLTPETLIEHLKTQLLDDTETEGDLMEATEGEGEEVGESPEHEAAESPEFEAGEKEGAMESEINEHKSEEPAEDDEEESEEEPFEKESSLKAQYAEEEDSWVVYQGKSPVMKVSAIQAFGGFLNTKPAPGEYPKPFNTYHDVFKSKDYGDVLIAQAGSQGIEKICEIVHGDLVKTAQIGPGSVEPMGGPGPRIPQSQPYPDGTTEVDIKDQAATEGGDDSNFNPSEEAEQDMLETGEDKLLITDILVSFLATFIANKDYNLDEIMNQLALVFSNEGSTGEFRGALKREAERLSEGSTEMEGEALDEQIPYDEVGPDQGGAPPPGGGGDMESQVAGSGGMNSDEMAGMKLSQVSDTKDAIIDNLLKERSLRMKIASAVEYIKSELQNRGIDNVPYVPTKEYLMAQGMTKEAAIEEERNLIYKQASELVALDEKGFEALDKFVKTMPMLEDTSVVKEASIEKSASIQSANFGLFLENDPPVANKFEAVLPDNLFEGRYTEVARQANAERKSRKSAF